MLFRSEMKRKLCAVIMALVLLHSSYFMNRVVLYALTLQLVTILITTPISKFCNGMLRVIGMRSRAWKELSRGKFARGHICDDRFTISDPVISGFEGNMKLLSRYWRPQVITNKQIGCISCPAKDRSD